MQPVARQAARSTRAVAGSAARSRGSKPCRGTTESSTSRATRVGCASAYRSATKLPYETPSKVRRRAPRARRSRSMSATVSAVL